MTTLFQRIKNTVLADLHDVMDKKEMKNPTALLNQYLRDSEKEVSKVAKLIERHLQLKEEFHRELKYAEYMVQKRKDQSIIAEKANEGTLREIALQEQRQYEERLERLKNSYENTVTQLTELEQKHRDMQLKLKNIHIKRLELMGRENVIRVNQKINQMQQQADVGAAYSRFDEIDHYITNLESRINHGYEKDMFDYRISELENQMNDQDVNKKLTNE